MHMHEVEKKDCLPLWREKNALSNLESYHTAFQCHKGWRVRSMLGLVYFIILKSLFTIEKG